MTHIQFSDEQSAQIDHAELIRDDEALRQYEQTMTDFQRMLDDTLHTLKAESDSLIRLMDRVQASTEQRNKIVKDTIIKLYKLID